jgi:ribosomal protein S18 acetylase RimI-like enzyme
MNTPVELSVNQVRYYAVPLIYITMGPTLGDKAAATFSDSEYGTGVYGYFDQGKLVGICGCGEEIGTGRVWLGYFAVSPRFRNKGIGTKLLQYVEELIRKQGYEQIFIETYDHPRFYNARKLYEKFGYQRVGYIQYLLNDKTDAVYYRKVLQ